MTTVTTFTARRAIGALRIWPGDTIRLLESGQVEVVRTLPPLAEQIIRRAERMGDVRPLQREAA